MSTVTQSDVFSLFALYNSNAELIRVTYYNAGGGAALDLSSGGAVLGANFTQYLLLAQNAALLTGTNYELGAQIQTATSAGAWVNNQTNLNYQLFAQTRRSSFYIGDFCEMCYYIVALNASDQNIITASQRYFYSLE